MGDSPNGLCWHIRGNYRRTGNACGFVRAYQITHWPGRRLAVKTIVSVKRSVALEQWANAGEALLDLRTSGPFKGCGELLRIARDKLMPVWATGNAEAAAAAL